MAHTNPAAADPLTAGHKSISATEAHSRMHGRTLDIGENVKAHGARGDGTTDDSDYLQAAITTAGEGGTVIFPKPSGSYKFATTLVPLNGQRWLCGGRYLGHASAGTKLKYTGTGTAIDFTGVSGAHVADVSLECTTAGASLVAINLGDHAFQTNYNEFRNMSITGPGTTNGYAILGHGEIACACLNQFHNLLISNFHTAYKFSGYSNANSVYGGVIATVDTAIDLSRYTAGGDTLGGADNSFIRVEIDGSTTNGITLVDSAQRNQFYKLHMDGVTNAGSIDSGSTCTDNVFIGVGWAGVGFIDSGMVANRTTYIGCVGTGTVLGQVMLGVDCAIYRSAANEIRTPDNFESDGQLYASMGAATQVKAGYVGGRPGLTFGTADTHAIAAGTSSPEGSLSATVGSLFMRTDGSAGGILYVKETGSGSTGWKTIASTGTSAYAPTNVTTDRTYDANATSTDELADVLGTLIADLKSLGVIS